jgi:hypothetical protein
LKGFAEGGINTSPGMYALHGTRTKPEFIFNFEQFKNLFSSLNPNNWSAKINNFGKLQPQVASGGMSLNIDNLVNIQGNATPEVVTRLENSANNIANMVFSKIKKEYDKSGGKRML